MKNPELAPIVDFRDLPHIVSVACFKLLTHPKKTGKGIEVQKNPNQEGNDFDLLWPNIHLDRQIFKSVLSLLNIANCFTDERFKKDILPTIKHLLKNTQLFQFLADPEIVLTQAHQKNGLNSAEHIFKVLDELPTERLSDKHKLILRIFALHHDLGKAISAGLIKAEVEQALEANDFPEMRDGQGQLKNSFPDHQLTSALIFLSLYQGRTNQLQNELIGEEEINLIAYLIANHHSFSDFVPNPKELKHEKQILDWQEFFPGNRKLQELLLAYLFLFNYADTNATPAHQPSLEPNLVWMDKQLANLQELPQNLRDQIQAVISRELTDNNIDAKS